MSEKSKTFVFIYRCRLCKQIHEGPRTGNKNIVTDIMIRLSSGDEHCIAEYGIPVSKKTTHRCSESERGICDLVGVWETEDK